MNRKKEQKGMKSTRKREFDGTVYELLIEDQLIQAISDDENRVIHRSQDVAILEGRPVLGLPAGTIGRVLTLADPESIGAKEIVTVEFREVPGLHHFAIHDVSEVPAHARASKTTEERELTLA